MLQQLKEKCGSMKWCHLIAKALKHWTLPFSELFCGHEYNPRCLISVLWCLPLLNLFMQLTLVKAKGWGCPAMATLTVVSQMCGSWSPRAVTMNWTGSDRLATSCSVYTVPSGLTLKLGSLLTKPTSLLRWQSSNFTAEMHRKTSRRKN